MGLHNLEYTDPAGGSTTNLHGPSIRGTYAQRIAFNTSTPGFVDGFLWKETDTGKEYIWDATSSNWFLMTLYSQTPLSGIQNGIIYQAAVTAGDSYAGSTGANSGYGYMDLAVKLLNRWYPTVQEINYGYVGASSQDYILQDMPTNITNVPAYGYGPLGWLSINIGINNLRFPYNAKWIANTQGPSCCLNATAPNSLAASNLFKNDVQQIINAYRLVWPNTVITLGTIIDPSNNGAGPDTEFNGWTGGYANFTYAMNQYNARILELCNENNLVYCDFYNAMQGHPEWYGPDTLHPNNTGYGAMALVQEKAFLAIVNGDVDGSLPYNLISNIQNIPSQSKSIGPTAIEYIPGRFRTNSGIRIKIQSGCRLKIG